jgi:HNH endonuclease
MKASVRRLVRSRAVNRCEYCLLHEDDLPLFSFHVEHVIASKHGGSDDLDNLCWSCLYCNLAKSSNLSGRDPLTGRVVLLFRARNLLTVAFDLSGTAFGR